MNHDTDDDDDADDTAANNDHTSQVATICSILHTIQQNSFSISAVNTTTTATTKRRMMEGLGQLQSITTQRHHDNSPYCGNNDRMVVWHIPEPQLTFMILMTTKTTTTKIHHHPTSSR
jgi:hypothetical protein